MKIKTSIPLIAILLTGTVVWAASAERYLHVRVETPATHELVRVNVPLSLAAKIIPAINHGQLHEGKVHVGHLQADEIDIRAVLDALKSAPEGEFVTIQQNESDVRVAKERGQLVVHVVDKRGKENVDVSVPWEVAQALVSNTTDNELNIEAAIQALQSIGDSTLVTVADHDQTVRVWVDSNSSDMERGRK